LLMVHLVTFWVVITSCLWMYSFDYGAVDSVTAGVAMGTPVLLIGAVFKIAQQYQAEYSRSGVDLAIGKKTKTEVQVSGVVREVEN
jgi:hypothetical protein